MLLRLAYLAATNAFALLRLLPMSGREKDIEILALRHQLLVLQRQVGKPRFTDTDRAVLAGLLHHLPMDKLRHLLLVVRPDTILRWHRDLLKRRHAATCVPKRRGRPPTVRSIRALVLRLASENASWGYRRIHGELAALGIKVAASTVWEILKEHGIPPAPDRHSTTWADFLRSQAEALLACDLFETRTLTGARLYVFAVIEHSTRRIQILGATAHPTSEWIVQLGRNLLVGLEDAGNKARFLIRDRDSKFTAAFDALMTDTGLNVVTTGIRIPRWNQSHLLHALREFETFYNEHRPHRALKQAAPLRALLEPINEPAQIRRLEVRRRDRLGGTLHEYQHAA
ncbi:integrase [Streptomyces sp. NPDC020096]